MKTLNVRKMGGAAAQAGFTIIELVVVILLLGILTATALPRFLDVTDEAHDAVVQGVIGGFNTGAALFRAGWIANGQVRIDVGQFGGGTLDASTTGYPVGDDDGAAINTPVDCVAIFNGLLQPGGRPVVAAGGTLTGTTAAIIEPLIEAASSAADFVALTDIVPAGGPPLTATGCKFYYTGQFKTGTSSASASIPVLTYLSATGTTILDGTEFTLAID